MPYRFNNRKNSKRKKHEHASDILKRVLRYNGIENNLNKYKFVLHWEEVVGPDIATRCKPDRIKGDILYIRVSDSIWTQELDFMKVDILNRVNYFLSKNGNNNEKLKTIKFFLG